MKPGLVLNMSKRISYTVQGKVQGVFFRDFTQDKADEYGLTGWVRNERNGEEVKVEAQGSEEALAKFQKDLNQGPRGAHVTKVIPKEIEVKDGESSFERTRA